MFSCQVCWRTMRWLKRSNLALSKPVEQNSPDKTAYLMWNRAQRIPSWPGGTLSSKGIHLRRPTRHHHFSLAARRRTIHLLRRVQPKAAHLETWVEVARRSRCGEADHPGSKGPTSAVERLCHSAYLGGPVAGKYSHRLRAGRRRVRFRMQPHLLPRATPGSKHPPRQAPLQLQDIQSAPADARELPNRTVRKTLLDRKRLLGSETQTRLPCARQNPAHPIQPSPRARLGLQSIPPLAARSLTTDREDVNRARPVLLTFA